MLNVFISAPLTCNNAAKPVISIPGYPDYRLSCQGSWTVIMRHVNSDFSFKRPWSEYTSGFGNPGSDYWVGNVLLGYIMKNTIFDLRIELWDPNDRFLSAEFTGMVVKDAIGKFAINISSMFNSSLAGGSLLLGGPFSTYDLDNSGANCPNVERGGGWWFSEPCSDGVLTGELLSSTWWPTSRGETIYAKKVLMKIIPSGYKTGILNE